MTLAARSPRDLAPARAVGAAATGTHALGAIALGALATGAIAIGAIAIGKLVIGRARIRRLQIDDLVVGRVRRRAWSTPLEKAVGSLDAERVKAYAQASLAGTMPFPQIVEGLLREGVEYYLVDYPQRTFTFYGERGGAVVVPLTIPGLPDVAQDFDAPALQAAILDSQQHGQKYAAFCERAVKAGCQSYFAFLRGKRVLYMGRQGEQHVEWFPGAKPATP